ncbi:MAG: DUF1186 domain-containing protein [Cyanobacteriota bacterium]
MNVNEILQALEYFSNELPREALEAASQQKEELTPFLLAKLEEWKGKFCDLFGEEVSGEFYLHIYSFLLLAEFREQRAYPLIVDLMLEAGENADALFGDFITENLTSVLASVYDGNLSPLLRLINEAGDEYVQGAGIQALVILYLDSQLSREELLSNFETIGRHYLELGDTSDEALAYLAAHLTCQCLNIHGTELRGLIDELFDANLVDPLYVNRNEVNKQFTENTLEETLATQRKLKNYQLIDSAIGEMESWFCFQSPEEQDKQHAELERILATELEKYSLSLQAQPSSAAQPSSFKGADLSKAKADPKKKAKQKQQNLSRKKNRKKKR